MRKPKIIAFSKVHSKVLKSRFKRVCTIHRNPTVTRLCEKNKTINERGQRMVELNPVLILILILICGQGQRPGYTPEAIKAQSCWSA